MNQPSAIWCFVIANCRVRGSCVLYLHVNVCIVFDHFSLKLVPAEHINMILRYQTDL